MTHFFKNKFCSINLVGGLHICKINWKFYFKFFFCKTTFKIYQKIFLLNSYKTIKVDIFCKMLIDCGGFSTWCIQIVRFSRFAYFSAFSHSSKYNNTVLKEGWTILWLNTVYLLYWYNPSERCLWFLTILTKKKQILYQKLTPAPLQSELPLSRANKKPPVRPGRIIETQTTDQSEAPARQIHCLCTGLMGDLLTFPIGAVNFCLSMHFQDWLSVWSEQLPAKCVCQLRESPPPPSSSLLP